MRKRKLISTLTAASIVLQIGAPVFAYDDQPGEGGEASLRPKLFQNLVDFSGTAGVWDIIPQGTSGRNVRDNIVMVRGEAINELHGAGEYHADYIFNGSGPVKLGDGEIYGDVIFGNNAKYAWDSGVSISHGDFYFLGNEVNDPKESFQMNINGSLPFEGNDFVFFNRTFNANDIIAQSLGQNPDNRILLLRGLPGNAQDDPSLLQGSGSYINMLTDNIGNSQDARFYDLSKTAFKYADFLMYGAEKYPSSAEVPEYIDDYYADPYSDVMSISEFAANFSYNSSHSFVVPGSYTLKESGSRIGNNHETIYFFLDGTSDYTFNISSDLDLTGVAFVVLNGGNNRDCVKFFLDKGVDLTYDLFDNTSLGQGFFSVSSGQSGISSPEEWMAQISTNSFDPSRFYDGARIPLISIFGRGDNKINIQRNCTIEAYVGLFDDDYSDSGSGLFIYEGNMVNFYGRLMLPRFSAQIPLKINYCPAPDVFNAPEPTGIDEPTPEPTDTNTPTPEPTDTNTPTPEPTDTNTPTPGPTDTNTPTPGPTDTNTPTPEPTDTNTPTPEPTDTNTPTPDPTDTNTPTPDPTVTNTPTPGPTVTEIPLPVYDNPLFRHQLDMNGSGSGLWDISFGKNAPSDARDNTVLARGVPQRSKGGSPDYYSNYIFRGNGAVVMPDGRFHADAVFDENATWDMQYSHAYQFDGDVIFFGKPNGNVKEAFSNYEAGGIAPLNMNNLVLLNRSIPDSHYMNESVFGNRMSLPNLFMRGCGSYEFDDSLFRCSGSYSSSILEQSYAYFNSSDSAKIKQKTRNYEQFMYEDDSEYPVVYEIKDMLDLDSHSNNTMSSGAFINAFGTQGKSSGMFVPSGEYHIKDTKACKWNSKTVSEPGDVIYFFLDGRESYKFFLESDYDLTGVVFVVLNKDNMTDAAFILGKDVDVAFGFTNLYYGYGSGFVSASSERSGIQTPDAWLKEVASDRNAAKSAEQYYTPDNSPEILIVGNGNNTINYESDGILEAYVGLFDTDYSSSGSGISFRDQDHLHVFGRFMTPSISAMNTIYVNYCPAPDGWNFDCDPVTVTNTPTPKPTNTNMPTPEPTVTNTSTPMPTDTNTPTPEPTDTNTPTPEPTSTNTPTPEPTATNTPTVTNTPTPKPTSTNMPTPTVTNTPTPEPTATNTPTPEPTATNTPTPEPTATNTPTPEPTATNTPVPPTATSTPTPEPTEADEPEPTPAIKKVKVEAEIDEDEIELNWNKIKKVTGYKIYRKTGNGDYKLIKTIKSAKRTNYSDEDVKNGKTYTYKVVGYKGNIEGSGKEAKIFYLEPVVLSKAKNVKPKSIKVTWISNSKATGYEVTCTLDDKPRNIMIKGSEKTNTTIKKLTKNKSYLISVRAYKTVSGNVYYSDWSDEKSVKIKK